MRSEMRGECQVWTGFVNARGYGQITINGRAAVAHRVSYELSGATIGQGMQIDHICHVRTCINPAHLRQVTNKQNQENRAGAQRNNLSSGVRGVSHDGRAGLWKAEVMHNKVRHYCGKFKTIEDAAEAVRVKRLELFTHSDMDK